MREPSNTVEKLAREIREMPPEIIEAILKLMRAMKHSLSEPTSEGTALSAAEKVVEGYREKATRFDFGLTPDADYAEEVMDMYHSTFPRMPMED